jgi:hypothetical protein
MSDMTQEEEQSEQEPDPIEEMEDRYHQAHAQGRSKRNKIRSNRFKDYLVPNVRRKGNPKRK